MRVREEPKPTHNHIVLGLHPGHPILKITRAQEALGPKP